MKIRLSDLKAKASIRPEGYYEEVLSKGTVNGDLLHVDGKTYLELLKKYDPQRDSIKVQPCCGQQPINHSVNPLKMPPIKDIIRNAAGSAVRLAGNAIRGNKIMATKEKVEERTNVCRGCEFWAADRERCSICGCYTKVKISIEGESCPKGKW